MNISKNNRQLRVAPFLVDGYDPTTNTIYEFLGDYWHGNPKKFNPNDINRVTKTSFKTLYDDTFIKFNKLKDSGYNVKFIWESDWDFYIKNKTNIINILSL